MSRMHLRSYLARAKQSLSQYLQSPGEYPLSLAIGNESADLDSIISAVVYGYIQSSKLDAVKANRVVVPVANIPASDLSLRPELTALLRQATLSPRELVTLDDLGHLQGRVPRDNTEWTLVDHNVFQGALGEHFSNRVVSVIDHHEDENRITADAQPRIIEKAGSCSSLVVNYCREAWDLLSSSPATVGAAHSQGDVNLDDWAYTSGWDAHVAKLALGAVLIDTINMTAEPKITEHDRKAVRYLEAKINISPRTAPSYDRDRFFNEINAAKSDIEGMTLQDVLRKDYKQWTEEGFVLGISSVVKSLEYLQTRNNDILGEMLKFAKGRGVHLFAVMTAHNDKESFARQLLLLPIEQDRSGQVVKKFADDFSQELQLAETGCGFDTAAFSTKDAALEPRIWEQANLAASRKRVAPMLRQAAT